MLKKISFPILLTVFILINAGQGISAELCLARINCLPIKSTEIVLPEKVIGVNSSFRHCSPTHFLEELSEGGLDTISLFFIIDHSASMSFYDSTSSRYQITNNIIDSVKALSPASEVGLTVFSNQLLHKTEIDGFYEPLYPNDEFPDADWTDAYIPLTKLNSSVGELEGSEKVKESILLDDTELDRGDNYTLINGDYSSTGRTGAAYDSNTGETTPIEESGYMGTTDIALAFEAARKAMKESTRPPEDQYIIFLSDGVTQHVDIEREEVAESYIQGEDIPTTFVAFWINENNATIPDRIKTMVENIKDNGYSTNNPNSSIWTTTTDITGRSDLVSRLIDKTAGDTNKVVYSTPKEITINGVSSSTFSPDTSMVYFDEPFYLTGDSTEFDMIFEARFGSPMEKDSIIDNTIQIIREEDAAIPDNVTLECWEQGSIEFLIDGNEVTRIPDEKEIVEVRYYPPAEYPVNEADVKIRTASGSDSLVLSLSSSASYFSATFQREFASPMVDNVLQNGLNDSLQAIYRNPEIPLDVVTHTVNILNPRDFGDIKAWYFDNNADGYPDVISVNLESEIYPDEVDLIENQGFVEIDSDRGITKDSFVKREGGDSPSDGFGISLDPDLSGPVSTGIQGERELLVIDETDLTAEAGGYFPFSTIEIGDSMGPVIDQAEYLDIADPEATDTLVVSFSEHVKTIGSTSPFLFTSSDGIEYSLNLSRVEQSGTEGVFAVNNKAGQETPKSGDSIWIDPEDEISDTSGIVQDNPENRRVPLLLTGIIQIIRAEYRDTSDIPDGITDIIRVSTDRQPTADQLSELKSTIDLPSGYDFEINDIKEVPESDSTGFDIHISYSTESVSPQDFESNDNIMNVDKTGSKGESIIHKTEIEVIDMIPPVVTSAEYVPGTYEDFDDEPENYLIVEFNEAVDSISEGAQPFSFYDPESEENYTMELEAVEGNQGKDKWKFLVVSSEKEFPQSSDRMWLKEYSGTVDENSNVQNKETKHISLSVKPYEYEYFVKAVPNPASFNKEIEAEEYEYSGTDMIFIARTPGGVPEHADLESTMDIYDNVGNLVVAGKRGKIFKEDKDILFVWDGTNNDDKEVANGTYLGVITVKDNLNDKKKGYEKILIGVDRPRE